MMNLTENASLNSPGRHQIEHETAAWWTRVRAGISHFAASLAERRKFDRDLQTLYGFSDRELWDIGLGRSDVPGVMNGTFRRD